MRLLLVVATIAVTASLAQAQGRPAFEAASVKSVDVSTLGNTIVMNIGTVRHEELTFNNATLRDCVRFAYDISSDAQIAGPDWISSTRFLYDVIAKGAPGTSRE